MKYLVSGLLLLNIMMFVWLKNQPQTGDVLQPGQVSGKQLQLLVEVPVVAPAGNAPAPAVSAITEPTVTFTGMACYTLGAFASAAGAREADETLGSLGLATRQREGMRRELTGHWVYIPPLPSWAEAKKVTTILKARGVKDFQIVPTGPKKNAISLGFFRSRDSAEQHFSRISALGLNPEKEENYSESSGLWLDFSSPHRPPLPGSIVDALQQQYGDVALHERDCS